MNPRRIWTALTSGERLIVVASAVLLTLVLLGGIVLLGATPFQSAQTTPTGEPAVDTDGDGLSDDNEVLLFGTDAGETDTDGDGMPDGWEALNGQADPLTGRSIPDPARNDSNEDPDGDGLSNLGEYLNGTSPWAMDSDGDGLLDGWEVESGHDPLDSTSAQQDLDGDGLTAAQEHDQGTLDNAIDSDRDGLTDVEESRGTATIGTQSFSFAPTDPARRSTGGSGLADGFAVAYGLDPHDANVGRVDHDGDGLSTSQEARISLDRFTDTRLALTDGLDPRAADSDGDGLPDGWEVTHGLDPLDAADGSGDTDGDGLSNGREFFWNTDPLAPDTDGDGLPDGVEVTGWEITLNGRTVRATSNPLLPDSDNDGLGDLEERQGEAVIDGTSFSFNATHPLLPDSDGDGLPDSEEITLLFGDMRLEPTQADSDGDGLMDGEELDYWNQRAEDARASFPANLQAPDSGDCRAEAESAIQAQDPTVLGPGGDPDGDCLPNILDPDSDRPAGGELPPNSDPLLDGQEVHPGQVQERDIPASDPAIIDSDGDGLPDEWEVKQIRPGRTTSGASTLLFDPTNPDSDEDGVDDGADDDETACWSDLPGASAAEVNADGDTPPWLTDVRPFTNEKEMLAGTNPFRCDTDRDGLMDGWEAAYQSTFLDPTTALAEDEWWRGARIATACYKQHGNILALGDLKIPTLSDLDEVPEAGTLTAAPPAAGMQPTGDPGDRNVWATPGSGCQWDSTTGAANTGSVCPDCRIIGITATLDLQQWYRMSPQQDDADQDGADDAWELLWHQTAQGNERSFVDPAKRDADGDSDQADVAEEYLEGSNPLVPDTDGDGELDGPDKNPLAEEGGAGPVRDQDKDHLLDGCSGVHETDDPDRRSTLREVQIVEPEPGTFLCEPLNDEESITTDADGDGLPDAWELLQTYRIGNPSLSTIDPGRGSGDGDAIDDANEYRLGMPADWPEATVWWFGSNPFEQSWYDADGDGLPEALHLDPDPYATLPAAPTPQNAWDVACAAGIVAPRSLPLSDRCPDTSLSQGSTADFSWSSSQPQTALSVTIGSVGTASGSDRVIQKSTESIAFQAEVTEGSAPAQGVPVAVIALDPLEAQALRGGAGPSDNDLSQIAQPARVLCVLTTDAQGVATPSAEEPCSARSTTTEADLAGTARTWLGSQAPSWTRALSVLDPAASAGVEAQPENQVRIVAWAMGTGSDPGATAQKPVLVESQAHLEPTDLPDTVPSGQPLDISLRVVDGGADPIQAGSVKLTRGDHTDEQDLTEQTTSVTFSGVPMPTVTEATDTPVDLAFQPQNAKYLPPNSTQLILRVLPVPEIVLDLPGEATANRTLQVGLTLKGPDGDPVPGPVSIAMAGASTNATAGPDGTATLNLTVPHDVTPGTTTVTARFAGTQDHGATALEQQINVLQQLVTEVTPRTTFLGEQARFTLTVRDLAGVAPQVPTNVSLALGDDRATAELAPGEDLVGLTLPITGELGDTAATLNLNPQSKYEAVDRQVPLEVRSEAFLEIRPATVPRGQGVNLSLTVTDALGRPVPQATVAVDWSQGEENVTVTNGQATLPFSTAPDAPPEPVTLTYELSGPGVVTARRTTDLQLRIGTNLTGELSLDALAGTVAISLDLEDDQANPLAGKTLTVSWPLGEPVEVRADAEGKAKATLVVPEGAQPGNVPIQLRYPGDKTYLAAQTFLSAPIRAPTQLQVPEEIPWSETKDLRISGETIAVQSGRTVNLPLQVLQGSELVTEVASPGSPFALTLDSETVAELAGSSQRFTLKLATPGDEIQAPAETTVIIERRVPVEIAAGIDQQDDLVTLHLRASTPQGPLSQVPISVGHENGAPVQVTTDEEGEATVTLQGAQGTLIARYAGDQTRSPAEARVDLASQGPADTSDIGRIVILALVALLVAGDAVILWRVWRRLDIGRQVEQMLDEMEQGFMASDEVRAVIYHGYLRLRAIAEVMGYPEEEWETPREFGQRLSKTLQIDAEPMVGLVGAFEQARYSEQVDPALRMQVLEDLRAVRDDMQARGLIA